MRLPLILTIITTSFQAVLVTSEQVTERRIVPSCAVWVHGCFYLMHIWSVVRLLANKLCLLSLPRNVRGAIQDVSVRTQYINLSLPTAYSKTAPSVTFWVCEPWPHLGMASISKAYSGAIPHLARLWNSHCATILRNRRRNAFSVYCRQSPFHS